MICLRNCCCSDVVADADAGQEIDLVISMSLHGNKSYSQCNETDTCAVAGGTAAFGAALDAGGVAGDRFADAA